MTVPDARSLRDLEGTNKNSHHSFHEFLSIFQFYCRDCHKRNNIVMKWRRHYFSLSPTEAASTAATIFIKSFQLNARCLISLLTAGYVLALRCAWTIFHRPLPFNMPIYVVGDVHVQGHIVFKWSGQVEVDSFGFNLKLQCTGFRWRKAIVSLQKLKMARLRALRPSTHVIRSWRGRKSEKISGRNSYRIEELTSTLFLIVAFIPYQTNFVTSFQSIMNIPNLNTWSCR